MIKRHYFISAEKPHNDGKGSYSFQSITMEYQSFFADPDRVYRDATEHLAELMDVKDGDKIKIVSFNRI